MVLCMEKRNVETKAGLFPSYRIYHKTLFPNLHSLYGLNTRTAAVANQQARSKLVI